MRNLSFGSELCSLTSCPKLEGGRYLFEILALWKALSIFPPRVGTQGDLRFVLVARGQKS